MLLQIRAIICPMRDGLPIDTVATVPRDRDCIVQFNGYQIRVIVSGDWDRTEERLFRFVHVRSLPLDVVTFKTDPLVLGALFDPMSEIDHLCIDSPPPPEGGAAKRA